MEHCWISTTPRQLSLCADVTDSWSGGLIVRRRLETGLLWSVLAAGVLLQGCVPATLPYLRIEAPAASYFKSTCGGSVGAPQIVYYPFHGVFISIDPDPVLVGLHVPAGIVVQLNGDTVKMAGSTNAGPISKEIRLRLVPQSMVGLNVPPEFRKLPDPFNSDLTTLGPLTGASSNGHYRWYLFVGTNGREPERFVGPPSGLLEGTVEIPSITIDGQRYPAQVLALKRESYFTVLPVNC
jgi:hypothetical protein